MLSYHVHSSHLLRLPLRSSRFLPFLCVLVREISPEPQNLEHTGLSLYMKGIYCNDLWPVVLTKPTIGSSEWEDKITSRSSVYEASLFHLIFCINWNPEDVDINKCDECKFKQSKSESHFFQCPYIDLSQKVWLRLKVCTTLPRSGPCFVPGGP